MDKNKVMKEITDVYEKNQDKMLIKENVVGIGTGYKIVKNNNTENPCVTVFVSKKLEESLLNNKDIVPKELNHIPTDVVEIGEVFAGTLLPGLKGDRESDINNNNILNQRMRPAVGGLSVGHFGVTTFLRKHIN